MEAYTCLPAKKSCIDLREGPVMRVLSFIRAYQSVDAMRSGIVVLHRPSGHNLTECGRLEGWERNKLSPAVRQRTEKVAPAQVRRKMAHALRVCEVESAERVNRAKQ